MSACLNRVALISDSAISQYFQSPVLLLDWTSQSSRHFANYSAVFISGHQHCCCVHSSCLTCCVLSCCAWKPFSLIAGLWQPGAQKSRHGAKFSQAVSLDFQSKPYERVLWKTRPVLGSTAQWFFTCTHCSHYQNPLGIGSSRRVIVLPPVLSTAPGCCLPKHAQGDMALHSSQSLYFHWGNCLLKHNILHENPDFPPRIYCLRKEVQSGTSSLVRKEKPVWQLPATSWPVCSAIKIPLDYG